ncbi:rhodanese-like domain-containing protein [uncultured Jannaschia sp.]|uniref:sulfurtransferase n=1 Tax=uncultured Jannaschia sp. TaxID=293347 RepID=UPI002609A9DF|nr:rhodanese-like domain-containing protein [uncultured Jannaschia sp.]
MLTLPQTALIGAFALAASAASAADLAPLVAPADLEAALDEVRVIDIRSAENDGFGRGHVPGAASAPYQLFRGPAENPGAIVAPDALEQTYRELGLETADHVVITYQGSDVTDFGAAARVYWTLKSSGFEDLSILNGGVNAWIEAGYELSNASTEVEASDIEVTWNDRWTATVDDVQQAIGGEDEALLLDARSESFWEGRQSHPAAAKPGTLPQSQYFEHAGWFSDGPAIVDADAARDIAIEQDFTDAEAIISFCNTGHWAATNWFALSELAGIENVKLYPESMVGWSNAGYEMANVPGPLRVMWNKITSAF